MPKRPVLVDEAQASGPVKVLFNEIKATLQLPFVPKIFRALAVDPAQLATLWARLKTALGDGAVDVRTKVLAALAVATAARAPYFVSAYTAVLKRLGTTAAEVGEVQQVAKLAAELNIYAARLGLEPDLSD